MESWIKLHRKFDEWEWFNISEMVHLYIYLILNANCADGNWRGIEIKRGQILTGLYSLRFKTKISVSKLRTCLKRLEKTGEIDIQTTNKYSIITICNYETYQSSRQTNRTQPDKQIANKSQTNRNKQEYKNKKNNKEVFINEVNSFNEYPENMLEDFIRYWSEPNKSGRMKWELQKTWDTNLRLITWSKRSNDFDKKGSTTDYYTYDQMVKLVGIEGKKVWGEYKIIELANGKKGWIKK